VRRTFGIDTLPINWSRRLNGLPRAFTRRLLKAFGRLVDVGYTFARFRRFDLMIIPGTGILDDFGERPWGMPFDIFRWCLVARLAGARIAMISIGAGPIGRPLSRRLMKAAAGLAHYRSYRDEISKNFMEGIGFDTSADPVYPDIAFQLPSPAEAEVRPAQGGRLTVGVGAMSYHGWYGFAPEGRSVYAAYIDKLTAFALHLLDDGYNVRLITGEDSDQGAVEDVLARLREARPAVSAERVFAEPARSLHDVMRQMAGTDVAVATRFHNIVCALKVGRPCISLGYARKNDVLMAEMGLGGFCQHVEHFDLDLLMRQFRSLVADRAEHECAIRARVEIFEQRLRQQDEMLFRWLSGGETAAAA
jgi:polysaccharide pyruvyl transferase WcaK-like protein